jgi:nucleotide-binding universal stress UspA family protein
VNLPTVRLNGPVVALATGGPADRRVLETSLALAERSEPGRLVLVSGSAADIPRASDDRVRIEHVWATRDLIAAAEAQALAAGAACLVTPSSPRVTRRFFRYAPCPLLAIPAQEPPDGPILVPVDFSRSSREAARFAVSLARPVLLLHVYRVPLGWHKLGWSYTEFARRMEERCRQDMTALVAELDGGTVQTALELEGEPASAILRVAKTRRASLVVLASPRRTWASAAVPGVAERIAMNAEVPVWILRDARPMTFLEAIAKG